MAAILQTTFCLAIFLQEYFIFWFEFSITKDLIYINSSLLHRSIYKSSAINVVNMLGENRAPVVYTGVNGCTAHDRTEKYHTVYKLEIAKHSNKTGIF